MDSETTARLQALSLTTGAGAGTVLGPSELGVRVGDGPSILTSKMDQLFQKLGSISNEQTQVHNKRIYFQKTKLKSHSEFLRGIAIKMGSIHEEGVDAGANCSWDTARTEVNAKLAEIKESFGYLETVLSELGLSDSYTETLEFVYRQIQKIVGSLLLVQYYQTGSVESPENFSKILGLPLITDGNAQSCKIYLDTHTYQLALLDIGEEMYEYVISGVGLGYYKRPEVVSTFMRKVVNGLSLLYNTDEIIEMLKNYEELIMQIRRLKYELRLHGAVEREEEITSRFEP